MQVSESCDIKRTVYVGLLGSERTFRPPIEAPYPYSMSVLPQWPLAPLLIVTHTSKKGQRGPEGPSRKFVPKLY